MNSWYSFEPHGRTLVTLVTTADGRRGLIGARGTRYFKKHIQGREDAREVVGRALDRMPYVSSRWRKWPSAPRRKDDDAEPITLPALMLATGRSEDEIDRLAGTSFGEPT